MPVECDELGSFLHQGFGHIGHTSWHWRLADADSVSHRRLERARCVEAQCSQHLDLRTDGSRPLGASAQRLTHRKNVREAQHSTDRVYADFRKTMTKDILTSLSNSTRYRINSLGKPNWVRRKLSETESRSKRSRVLWPRPCRSRSQSKMAIEIAMLCVIIHLRSQSPPPPCLQPLSGNQLPLIMISPAINTRCRTHLVTGSYILFMHSIKLSAL